MPTLTAADRLRIQTLTPATPTTLLDADDRDRLLAAAHAQGIAERTVIAQAMRDAVDGDLDAEHAIRFARARDHHRLQELVDELAGTDATTIWRPDAAALHAEAVQLTTRQAGTPAIHAPAAEALDQLAWTGAPAYRSLPSVDIAGTPTGFAEQDHARVDLDALLGQTPPAQAASVGQVVLQLDEHAQAQVPAFLREYGATRVHAATALAAELDAERARLRFTDPVRAMGVGRSPDVALLRIERTATDRLAERAAFTGRLAVTTGEAALVLAALEQSRVVAGLAQARMYFFDGLEDDLRAVPDRLTQPGVGAPLVAGEEWHIDLPATGEEYVRMLDDFRAAARVGATERLTQLTDARTRAASPGMDGLRAHAAVTRRLADDRARLAELTESLEEWIDVEADLDPRIGQELLEVARLGARQAGDPVVAKGIRDLDALFAERLYSGDGMPRLGEAIASQQAAIAAAHPFEARAAAAAQTGFEGALLAGALPGRAARAHAPQAAGMRREASVETPVTGPVTEVPGPGIGR